MTNPDSSKPQQKGSATSPGKDAKAVHESGHETVSETHPGGFKNDPDDPTNPNAAIERSRSKLRGGSPDQPPRK